MMNMMEQCWSWMMSLGMAGMLLGGALLIALLVLVLMAIVYLARRLRHGGASFGSAREEGK